MLKKLLKGCLTVAMVGAFAAGVSAADMSWSGNAEGTFKQTTSKTGAADAVTTMDIASSGDLDLSAKTAGDAWTGEAKIEFDVNAAGVSAVDDLYAVMSNDGMEIWFGEFDPVGFAMGHAYTGEVDETKGAWGAGGINEDGYVEVKLKDVGASVVLGFNEKNDGTSYNQTTFGVTYGTAMDALDLKVQYFSASTKYNVADVTGDYDGASEADLLLGVAYNMDKMTFGLNYQSIATKTGAEQEDANTYIELVFDMGLDDVSGISFAYDMNTETDKTASVVTSKTLMQLTYKMSTGPVDHYIAYVSSSEKDDNDANGTDADTMSILGYTMSVGF